MTVLSFCLDYTGIMYSTQANYCSLFMDILFYNNSNYCVLIIVSCYTRGVKSKEFVVPRYIQISPSINML